MNLAQGFPDFPCPEEIKEAACRAIRGDVNQYAITWGAKGFREALATKVGHFTGMQIDPEREITVTCGSTEAMIAALCIEHDCLAITDEIYEHILFDGHEHVLIATLPGMRERTITINGLSKTYSVTGWRIGYAIASPALTAGIRKVHDFLTVGAAAPLQEAGVTALSLPDSYYRGLADLYRVKRDRFVPVLERVGFRCFPPSGAYYVMADISGLTQLDAMAFALELVRDPGVAVVPGSSFFSKPADGRSLVRFCFCKRDETLDEAARRLERWAKGWREGEVRSDRTPQPARERKLLFQ